MLPHQLDINVENDLLNMQSIINVEHFVAPLCSAVPVVAVSTYGHLLPTTTSVNLAPAAERVAHLASAAQQQEYDQQ